MKKSAGFTINGVVEKRLSIKDIGLARAPPSERTVAEWWHKASPIHLHTKKSMYGAPKATPRKGGVLIVSQLPPKIKFISGG